MSADHVSGVSSGHVSGARTARGAAAVFDLTGWTVIGLAGGDAVKFLNNFCTADVKKLSPGGSCEAFLTNVKARVVGHGFVFAEGEMGGASLTLVGSAGQNEKLVAHLDRYLITEKVEIRDRTGEAGLLYVVGPDAEERVRGAGGGGVVRRVDFLGGPGFLIETDRGAVSSSIESLVGAGAARGSTGEFESLRIEACFPLYGVDVTEDQLAPEVGRPWGISYTKGCYLGQEPIARIDALGHVNRLLCGLRLETADVPERAAAVVAEGKEVGAVTSAGAGIGDGMAVAMGYVRAKFAEEGARVAVRVGGEEVGARVYRAARAMDEGATGA